jgi:hypothetical protein
MYDRELRMFVSGFSELVAILDLDTGEEQRVVAKSPKRPRADLVDPMVHAGFIFGSPEAELLGPARALKPLSSERQESSGSARDYTHLSEVGQSAE